MTVRVRLQRFGRRNRPFYRVVVADSRAPRDGKFIELVSTEDLMPADTTYTTCLWRGPGMRPLRRCRLARFACEVLALLFRVCLCLRCLDGSLCWVRALGSNTAVVVFVVNYKLHLRWHALCTARRDASEAELAPPQQYVEAQYLVRCLRLG